MKRAVISDSTQWFDKDAAKEFLGKTGVGVFGNKSAFYEMLYQTKKGIWVLYKGTTCLGMRDTYSVLSAEECVAWMLRNEHIPGEELQSVMEGLEI